MGSLRTTDMAFAAGAGRKVTSARDGCSEHVHTHGHQAPRIWDSRARRWIRAFTHTSLRAQVDGQPWCTAHYGFHMPLWHIPFAMTGQTHSVIEDAPPPRS